MKISLEEKIIEDINKNTLTKEESIELIEDLYWADWDLLNDKYKNHLPKIFNYLRKDNHSQEEISQIMKLYNNPHGAYVDEFSDIIIELYKKDRVKFIISLNMEKDEISNLVYLFRNNNVVIDEDEELLDIIQSDKLSEEEKETGNFFIKMYENVCNTWV